MNIDEAILIGEFIVDFHPSPLFAIETEAIELGILSLKRERERRKHWESFDPDLLPGETEK